jgi:LacI family transcriptional regulator
MNDTPRRTGSIKDVAALAGVGIATVSRVMNGVANKASPETTERVRKAAAMLDYRPTSAGRALRSRQTRLVALLASNLANPTMAAIAASAETAIRQAGLVMVLCDTHDQPDLQDEYLREMRARQAHAIVLLGAVRSPLLDSPLPTPEKVIFVNRRDPMDRPSHFVGIDNERAAAELAETCIELGLGRIVIIHGSRSSSATEDRLRGLKRTLLARGQAVADGDVMTADGIDHLEIGRSAGQRVLAAGIPDAVIGLSDLIAFGAHRAFLEAGVAQPPRFFGFDDNPLNDWIAPWLSSVRIPYADFGAAIMATVVEHTTPGQFRQMSLPHRLVIRPLPEAHSDGRARPWQDRS